MPARPCDGRIWCWYSHSYQRASSAEGSESLGGRASAIVRERLFHLVSAAGKGLTLFHRDGSPATQLQILEISTLTKLFQLAR